MGLTNEEIIALDKHIEKKIKKILREELDKYGLMKGWGAKVSSVNVDGTINVKISMDSENIIPSLKNKTNQTLIAGDEVFLFSISSLTNAFIGVKK